MIKKALMILLFPVFILLIGPICAIRIIRIGAQEVARFRVERRREPNEQEWREMSMRTGKRVIASPPTHQD